MTLALGMTLAIAACNDPLEVRNNDAPNVANTLATPSGIEAATATTYQAIWSANNGSAAALYPQLMNMSFESYSSAGNFAMTTRNAIPRSAITNSRGSQSATDNFRDFSGLSRNSRAAANVLIALDILLASGQTLGSAPLNARARAFAFFTDGVSLGNLALAYDSAAIVIQTVPSGDVPPLRGAADVMKAALTSLDSAVAIAGSSAVAGGFPLPSTWINGRAMSAAEFVRFARSYRARFRAGVSRTPAQRAAVDWGAVLADVTSGIQTDVNVTLDPATGWTNGWLPNQFLAGLHQMTPMIIGMADTSGEYDRWLSLPLDRRESILIKTPDRRFPSGDTRAAQTASSPTPLPAGQYFRSRNTGGNVLAETWGSSIYDFYRWQPIFAAGGRGEFPLITMAEMDMLAAEGHLRQGQIAAAATLIDKYRARAGLPVLSGTVTTATMPVPGGRACVPRVPTAAGNAAACGTIFEAMKWEKRMETAFTGWASWYFDSRGWGDLPEGTPLEFPVPFQELEARQKPFYDLGGIGGKSAAAKGTYGF
jgi:hypothetical protein